VSSLCFKGCSRSRLRLGFGVAFVSCILKPDLNCSGFGSNGLTTGLFMSSVLMVMDIADPDAHSAACAAILF
jgi:hypothetical protein